MKRCKIKDEKMIEEKNEESASKLIVFQIPIEKYEKDMNVEKKNEIIDLLTNSNKLRSEKDYDEIKDQLHELCQEGNLDLIKILLSETIQNYSETYTFKVNKANQTASLFKVYYAIRELIIPRKIQLESKEYLITSICGTSQFVKNIYFSENSAVKTIYRNSIPHNAEVYIM